ncbi:GtrA family protein [Patescibacteria group bacterium]
MTRILQKLDESKYVKKLGNHPVFKKYPSLRQMFKFAIIGIINTSVDFTIYIFLTRGFGFWMDHYLWANFISFMISISITFDLVREWIFKLPGLPDAEMEANNIKLPKEIEKKIHIQYFKFLLVSFIGFLAHQIGLYSFVEFLYIHDILTKAFMAVVVWILRFNVHRFWTFKDELKNNIIIKKYDD